MINPESLSHPHLAAQLNDHFSHNGSAFEAQKLLTAIENPILVDFNGVLVSKNPTSSGLFPINPKAASFLNDLKFLGNIVVITAATDYGFVQKTLKEGGLWSSNMVLMTAYNYSLFNPINSSFWDTSIANYTKLRMLNHRTLHLNDVYKLQYSGHMDKCVAPFFGRSYDIPLIDDRKEAVTHNPGILGKWSETFLAIGEYQNSPRQIPLEQIPSQLSDHYDNM